jgi:hypothetical protein
MGLIRTPMQATKTGPEIGAMIATGSRETMDHTEAEMLVARVGQFRRHREPPPTPRSESRVGHARAARGFRSVVVLGLLGVSLAVGCSPEKPLESAKSATAEFHARYNGESYATIYAAADGAFKEASSEANFVKLMSAVHRKLGVEAHTRLRTWNVIRGAAGTHVIMSYSSQFEAGEAREDFTWVVDGEHTRLVGYNINSPTLVLK